MKKNEVSKNGRLSLRTRLGFGVGDFGANLVFQSTLIFLIFYFTDVFGIAAPIAGTIFLVAKAWDAVCDPVVGYCSDRTRTRWGKKRPYLLFGAIPLGVFFFLLFASPPMPPAFKPYYGMILFLLFCTFYAVVNVPYGALAASMTQDSHERSRLSGVRTFFALMGALVVAGSMKPLVALFPNQVIGFRMTAAIFGVVAVAVTYVTFFSVREVVEERDTEHYKLTDIMKTIFGNGPFLIVSLGTILHLAALGILAAMVNYYFKYNMGREAFATVAFLCIFVPAALALPLWVAVSNKLSKKAAFNMGMGLLAVALVIVYFIRDFNPVLIIVAFCLGGIGISTSFLSPWAMVPDTVEYGELKTGLRREGILYGTSFFGQKLASALAGFIAGQGLGIIGFEANKIQSPEVLEGIRVLMIFAPIVLIVAGIIVISFYPISEKMHRDIVDKLQKGREGSAAS
ncbi:MAG: MFS transporter [Deltaproteobacteria bacterium]|nr:MFS transporter [Candidatus Zymogenaceae bacterium]